MAKDYGETDLSNKTQEELDKRNREDLSKALATANYTLYKNYLNELTSFTTIPFINIHHELDHCSSGDVIELLGLKKVCLEKGEDSLQKLSSVYNSAMAEGRNLMVLLDVQANCGVDVYLGFSHGKKDANRSANLLKAGFEGNFPGTEFSDSLPQAEMKDLFQEIMEATECISSVSASSSLRDKSKTEEKNFVQGIEKFIDAMQGEIYTAIFLAEPVNNDQQVELKIQLESLSTQLSIFEKDNISYTNGISKGISESTTLSKGVSRNTNFGGGASFKLGEVISLNTNAGQGFGHHQGTANQKGFNQGENSGETLQFERKNKIIENMLRQIDCLIEKIEQGNSYGLYRFGAYFLTNRPHVAALAAHTYRALLLGDGTETDRRAINTWKKGKELDKIKSYLSRGQHPIFQSEKEQYDATTFVNGLELPIHMGIPTKSVVGLPVVEHARFGRSVSSRQDTTIELGRIFHMGKVEKSEKVSLDVNHLASHTFITGSTGSGKSNTVYSMLDKLLAEKVKFMVIEPAKGEYKKVFGGRSDVEVYGTNPYKVPNLLQINPFSFPVEDTHVLEHIDRLVEVFNACWPMYAAMPAILKEAVEKSYLKCGWNLSTSVGGDKFPTFELLLETLPEVVERSQYSQNTSSDYKGALVTRVRSLTTGIFGQIFKKDLADEKLFNENVIIDLSRVGSQETKALIMGILVLKLQEFRMSEDTGSDEKLRHVTVLEEAHNLLKRTSSEQSQEGSNLQGKSVEMLANAIAEMRTYGEGFIIADQSPGLLDMSVIRNTNTKIIMRLPDEDDRKLVGKAAALNDDQIIELAKLDCGVAAVSESGWLEPVLCQVDLFDKDKKKPMSEEKYQWVDMETVAVGKFLLSVFCKKALDLSEEEVDCVRKWVYDCNFASNKKLGIFSVVKLLQENQTLTPEKEKAVKLTVVARLFSDYPSDVMVSPVTRETVIRDICRYYGLENNDPLFEEIGVYCAAIQRTLADKARQKEELEKAEVK